MGLNFRKTFKLGPLQLNINKGGVSITAGTRGAHVTIGKEGITYGIGIPGMGVSYRKKLISFKKRG